MNELTSTLFTLADYGVKLIMVWMCVKSISGFKNQYSTKFDFEFPLFQNSGLTWDQIPPTT